MDQLYGLYSPSSSDYHHPPPFPPKNLISPSHYPNFNSPAPFPIFGFDQLLSASSVAVSDATSMVAQIQGGGSGDEVSSAIRTQIATHPLYPKLLHAYIECQKVGAPPEVAYLLEEIRRGSELCRRNTVSTCLGADPELDEFMETYCNVLMKYKSDLARPFDEATAFLNNIETQLNTLCNGASRSYVSDEVARSLEEGLEEVEGGKLKTWSSTRRVAFTNEILSKKRCLN